MENLEHLIRMYAGHDCIRFHCKWDRNGCKPGAGGSHGKHGLEMLFMSKGSAGAVQFKLSTMWLPQYVEENSIRYREIRNWHDGTQPFPCDLGYHSKVARFYEQEPISESCEYCDGAPCYYDGSSLNCNDAMYALVNGGDEALWAFLDAYYECVFNGAEYPQPQEYGKALR